jgi:hypothetical protein
MCPPAHPHPYNHLDQIGLFETWWNDSRFWRGVFLLSNVKIFVCSKLNLTTKGWWLVNKFWKSQIIKSAKKRFFLRKHWFVPKYIYSWTKVPKFWKELFHPRCPMVKKFGNCDYNNQKTKYLCFDIAYWKFWWIPWISYRMGKTGPGLFSWQASNMPLALLLNSVSLVLLTLNTLKNLLFPCFHQGRQNFHWLGIDLWSCRILSESPQRFCSTIFSPIEEY